jgi:transcriptional regulator with XRE-family HTH domain
MGTVPERLRLLRLGRNYSRDAIADAVGMGRSTLTEWESSTPRAFAHLARLAERYGVSADYLLGLTDDPTPLGRGEAPPPYSQEMTEILRRLGPLQAERLVVMAQAWADHEDARRQAARIEMRIDQIAEELGGESFDAVMDALLLAARTGDAVDLRALLDRTFAHTAPQDEVQ